MKHIVDIQEISVKDFENDFSNQKHSLKHFQEPLFLELSRQHLQDNLHIYDFAKAAKPESTCFYLKISLSEGEDIFMPCLKLKEDENHSIHLPCKTFRDAIISKQALKAQELQLISLELNDKMPYSLNCRQSLMGFDLQRSLFHYFSKLPQDERTEIALKSPLMGISRTHSPTDFQKFESLYAAHLKKDRLMEFPIYRNPAKILQTLPEDYALFKISYRGRIHGFVSGILKNSTFLLFDFIGTASFNKTSTYGAALILFFHLMKTLGVQKIETTSLEWVFESVFKKINFSHQLKNPEVLQHMERWGYRGVQELPS